MLQISDSLYKVSYTKKHIIYNLSIYKESKYLIYMQQQNLTMPVSCNKCGELFDLAYDAGNKTIVEEVEYEIENPKKTKVLCWACRK